MKENPTYKYGRAGVWHGHGKARRRIVRPHCAEERRQRHQAWRYLRAVLLGRGQQMGVRKAESNVLSFDGVPKGALMWLRDYTRRMDERPFLIDGDGGVEWW